jgi:hypothetical protein
MNKSGYIPKENRKKILLICDDIRVHSGVATVARELILNSAYHYNWVNVAGAINHPDIGKRLDISEDINKHTGIQDANITLYPVNGYGDSTLIRQLMDIEKPDAIFLITDPRYFIWLFSIESEIRKTTPIIYLNIWDDLPAPHYNKPYYDSCDALLGISKHTVNINKLVLGDKVKNKIISYVPHGLNEKIFRPITEGDEEYTEFKTFIKHILNNK